MCSYLKKEKKIKIYKLLCVWVIFEGDLQLDFYIMYFFFSILKVEVKKMTFTISTGFKLISRMKISLNKKSHLQQNFKKNSWNH